MMRKLRILRVIARMNIGGPAIQITGLMQNLSSSRYEQILLTGYCDENEIDFLEDKCVELPIIRLEGFGRRINLLSDIKVFFEIRNLIRTFNPDIIHTHTSKAGFLGRLAAISSFRQQIRIHTYHGHLLKGYFGAVNRRLLIWIESFLARYTDSLIAVGNAVRDDLVKAGIGEMQKYQVIGPGVEIRDLVRRELALKLIDIPRDKFIVSWVGRVVPIKAPQRIIEVAYECWTRKLNVHFVVAGDGPLLQDLIKRATSLNLPITFLGWQSDIENILSVSDLVILTSENEGTPIAIIQAQMAGIPVLTTDVGSASEVMIDAKSGFCLNYSAKEFADRIYILSKNHKLHASFGAAGRINARDKFSVMRLVTDHEILYDNLVNQSKF